MKSIGSKVPELKEEYQDASFNGYSLSRDLIRSVSSLSLPHSPYLPPSTNEISLQRYHYYILSLSIIIIIMFVIIIIRSQARFKFNHLFVNPSSPVEYAYFVGKDFSLYSINLQVYLNFIFLVSFYFII